MSEQTISVGRIVQYTLDQNDADKINRRRTNAAEIAARIKDEKWPLGAQAHIGNEARAGQIMAMIVVAVWGSGYVNGQVFLDGTDALWVTSIGKNGSDEPMPHSWHWPPRS